MARRRHHEEHQNHEAWAIPYGDLITLLLAFFVVMYAMSSVNEGKYRILSDSLNAAFRGTPETLQPVQFGQKQVGSGADVAMTLIRQQQLDGQPRDLLATIPVHSKETAAGKAAESPPAFEVSPEGRVSRRQLSQVADEVEQAMAELIQRGLIAVRRKHDSVEVEIRADILFPSGQSQLTPTAERVIEQLGTALAAFPNSINVEGHTDDRPISTPAFPSNWELSAGRAASVVRLLTQQQIDPVRLKVVGYGDQQPIASNASVEGRNANRRVLLVVRAMEPTSSVVKVAHATP
jgi:chemotaxis protein MotB